MRTFVEVLRDNAVYTDHAHTFVGMGGDERVVSYPDLWRIACQRAHRLHELGLKKGDRVAIILPEPDGFILTFMGALTGGIVPVPMYPPLTLAKMEAYGETVRHILKASGAKILITCPGLKDMLEAELIRANGQGGEVRVVLDNELEGEPMERPHPPCDVTPDDLAFLQFTSGSTRKPKGVMVTHGNLSANAHAIMFDGLRCEGATDKGVSWLPLYHDMGLIGFVIAPIFAQVQVMFLPTMSFIRRPSTWLDAIDRHRGSITFAPNFAYALSTRAVQERQSKDWDLSCLKAVGCGAEPIQPEVLRAFCDRFADNGLKPEAILPCYGLAEATLAVTFAPLNARLHTDRVDVDKMKAGEAVPTNREGTELVSCGKPFPGHEIKIAEEDGTPLAERMVGEVWLRGPSVTKGYYKAPDETADSFVDGWLRTGDLGYLADGELYVCGRIKDLIILNGKNYYPQDIERVVSLVRGIRPDQTVAFSRLSADGAEECVVVAEVRKLETDDGSLERDVIQKVRTDLGVTVAEVVLIKRNTLPKTSSGKVRRREAKKRLALGALELPSLPPPPPPQPRPSSPATV
jgi:fatty-acyl-CoA synthase